MDSNASLKLATPGKKKKTPLVRALEAEESGRLWTGALMAGKWGCRLGRHTLAGRWRERPSSLRPRHGWNDGCEQQKTVTSGELIHLLLVHSFIPSLVTESLSTEQGLEIGALISEASVNE